MDFLWIIFLVPLIYIPAIAVTALLVAIFSGRKGNRAETFWDVFWSCFLELLNPFNWLG